MILFILDIFPLLGSCSYEPKPPTVPERRPAPLSWRKISQVAIVILLGFATAALGLAFLWVTAKLLFP